MPLDCCGKLILLRSEAEMQQLDLLAQRRQTNGVEVQWLDEAQVRAIESLSIAHERALFIPETATVDPHRLIAAQQAEIRESQSHKNFFIFINRLLEIIN